MPRLIEFKWVEQASKDIPKKEIKKKISEYMNFKIREQELAFKKLFHIYL